MSYAADDTAAIAQRLKELEAERQLALTGSIVPVSGTESHTESWFAYMHDYDPA